MTNIHAIGLPNTTLVRYNCQVNNRFLACWPYCVVESDNIHPPNILGVSGNFGATDAEARGQARNRRCRISIESCLATACAIFLLGIMQTLHKMNSEQVGESRNNEEEQLRLTWPLKTHREEREVWTVAAEHKMEDWLFEHRQTKTCRRRSVTLKAGWRAGGWRHRAANSTLLDKVSNICIYKQIPPLAQLALRQ